VRADCGTHYTLDKRSLPHQRLEARWGETKRTCAVRSMIEQGGKAADDDMIPEIRKIHHDPLRNVCEC
jgi:hypothetical protein